MKEIGRVLLTTNILCITYAITKRRSNDGFSLHTVHSFDRRGRKYVIRSLRMRVSLGGRASMNHNKVPETREERYLYVPGTAALRQRTVCHQEIPATSMAIYCRISGGHGRQLSHQHPSVPYPKRATRPRRLAATHRQPQITKTKKRRENVLRTDTRERSTSAVRSSRSCPGTLASHSVASAMKVKDAPSAGRPAAVASFST